MKTPETVGGQWRTAHAAAQTFQLVATILPYRDIRMNAESRGICATRPGRRRLVCRRPFQPGSPDSPSRSRAGRNGSSDPRRVQSGQPGVVARLAVLIPADPAFPKLLQQRRCFLCDFRRHPGNFFLLGRAKRIEARRLAFECGVDPIER